MVESGARQDPFLSFRFEVRFDDQPAAGFSEVTGLVVETEVQDYMEGGLNTFVRKFPTRTKQVNLTFKRGIVDRALWEWYWRLTQGAIEFRSGSILLFDLTGESPVAGWDFADGFPIKWTGPDLNAQQNNVATETLEIAHHGLTRVT